MSSRIEDINGEEAAWVIRRYAEWVEETAGVWAVTVAEARYKKTHVDLHLIVHADLPEEDLGESTSGGAVTP